MHKIQSQKKQFESGQAISKGGGVRESGGPPPENFEKCCLLVHSGDILRANNVISWPILYTIFMESAFINATIITEFVLKSGPVLAGPTGPVPPALK